MAAFLALLLAVLGGVCLFHLYLERKRLPPGVKPLPGPRGFPLIGRVHDVPSESSWLKFYEWSQEYGPIYQMEIFGSVHVWISSEKIAHDLLSRRSAIYSDRPVIPNLADNRTSGDYLALLGRTDTWKRQRKLCHHLMGTSSTASLHGYPTRERDRFLYLMGQDPDNYIEWVEQFTSRTVSRLAWGSPHPAKVLRKTTFGLLEAISPSGALPNVISWLSHIPSILSPWKQKEIARHTLEAKLFENNIEYVQKMIDQDSASPSFIRTFLQDKTRAAVDEKGKERWGNVREGSYVAGLMAIAGALTIGSPIQSFFLAMCHYPDWQRQLQEEIDQVCEGKCPQWEDREKLPLLRAVVKEVMRWRPPVPTGIPHAVEKDDIYDGYLIPAGATIHALEWGMTRDQSIYPQPEMFNPQRWLSPEYPTFKEPLTVYPNLNGYSQFGFGRRTCQGVPIVEQDLFLTMGGLAWAFNIRKRRDENGMEIPIHWNDYTPLLIAKPVKFLFDVTPRAEDKEALLKAMFEGAREDEEVAMLDEQAAVDHLINKSEDCESDHDVKINIQDSSSESGSSSDAEIETTTAIQRSIMVKSIPGAWV